ncbi:MAG: C40 family peptidase [Actinomycetota bacterium]
MGKRGIALIIAAAAFLSSAGIAHAWEPPPPPPDPTPTCGEPTEVFPDLEPCPDPLVIPPSVAPAYTDIATHWARSAIRAAAYSRDWLRLGGSSFRPNGSLTRQVLAFGLVRAFGRDSVLDADLVFSDLPSTSSLWRYANVAVSRGWMSAPGGVFNPTGYVTKTQLNAAIARVFELLPVAAAVNAISSSDGYRFKHTSALGYHTIAHHLRTYFNFPNAMRYEIFPSQRIKRGEFAYALAQLADTGWRTWFLQERFQNVVLPSLTPTRRKVVEFALRYAGTPYTYGGETASTGVDCSGFVWWVMRKGMGNASSRGYTGWSLPDRSSAGIAAGTKTRISLSQLRPLDILTWDVEGEFTRRASAVGHAGLYLGNGWFIHSSGSRAGVALDWMGDGYWHDRFVWGRRIVPSSV